MLLRSVADNHSRAARLAGEVLTHNPALWSLPDLRCISSQPTPNDNTSQNCTDQRAYERALIVGGEMRVPSSGIQWCPW